MRLVGESEVVAGVDLPLRQNSVTIGTASGSSITLPEGRAAARHARLRRQGRVWFIEDTPGSPGTYLNGIRVTVPQVLRPGDHIIVGDAVFRLLAEPSDATPKSAQRTAHRGTWLGAAMVTFALLTAAVAGVATMPDRLGPLLSPSPTNTSVQSQPTTLALATATNTATATLAPTQTPAATATATRAAATYPASPPAIATEPGLDTMQTALAGAPADRAAAAMTVVAEMDSVAQSSALATIAAASPEEASAWLDGVLSTPTPPPLVGSIVFGLYSQEMGRYDVVRHDLATGTQTVLLTLASQPAMNSSGDTIAFHSWQTDALGLYSATADGSQRWLLTREAHAEDGQPDWSPDGATIAFTSLRYGDGKSRIYVVPVVGGDATDICIGEYVAWSPLGDRVAYKGCIGGACGIMFSAPDGGSQQLLTGDASDGAPAWSPDGQRIAFQSTREGSWDLYITDVGGGEVRRLTYGDTTETMPEWSADGLYIAFRSDADGEWGIWAVPASGGEPQKLFSANVLAGDEIVESFSWLP